MSDDGYILTARHLLVDESGETVDRVDVERDDGRHQVARIVGTEATIDLGVLKLEEFPCFRPTATDSSGSEISKWLYLSGIGRTIALEIYRDGKKLEKRITVEERPEAAVPR